MKKAIKMKTLNPLNTQGEPETVSSNVVLGSPMHSAEGQPNRELWWCEVTTLVEKGDTFSLENLHNNDYKKIVPRHLVIAIERNDMLMIEFLTKDSPWKIKILPWHVTTCIARGRLDALQYLHQVRKSKYVLKSSTLELAIRYSFTNAILYLLKEGYMHALRVTEKDIQLALKVASFETVKVLYEKFKERFAWPFFSKKTHSLVKKRIKLDVKLKKFTGPWD